MNKQRVWACLVKRRKNVFFLTESPYSGAGNIFTLSTVGVKAV